MTAPFLETPTPTDRLHEALAQFTGCVGGALEGICSYGLTVGETYVPFDLDEDEDCGDDDEEEAPNCSQAWVRVMSVSPKPGGTIGFGGQDCSMSLNIDLEVGVIRCMEIPEDGEAPSTTEVLEQALQAMSDMNAILCAALGCGSTEEDPEAGVWDEIAVGQWTPLGPLGGQHGGTWTFTVSL